MKPSVSDQHSMLCSEIQLKTGSKVAFCHQWHHYFLPQQPFQPHLLPSEHFPGHLLILSSLPFVFVLQWLDLLPLFPTGEQVVPQQLLLEKCSTSVSPPQQQDASVSTTNPSNVPANTTPPAKSRTIISRPRIFGVDKKFLIISKILLYVKET
jgi:hypothetical protein